MPAALGALLLAFAVLAGWPATGTAAAPYTIRIDPPTQNVVPGQQVTVSLIQSAGVPTTGAQVDVIFDPKLLQLEDFGLGPAYTSESAIFAFGNADKGTNAKKELAIGAANVNGRLENAAGFLLPGSGTIPAGDNVFLQLTFVGQPGKGGKVNLGLINGSMIDATGQALNPFLEYGEVTVAAGVAPSPGSSPGASPSGSAEPNPSPEATGPAPSPSSPATPVTISVAPTSLTLHAGDQARVFLIADADGDLTSLVADLAFDRSKLQVTGIEPGPAWEGATTLASVAGGTSGGSDAAIAEANGTTGVLHSVGVFFAPGAEDLPYGEGVFVSVLVKATADATSSLSVSNAAAIGVSGETIPVTIAPGSLTKPPDKGIQVDPTIVIPLVVLLVVVIGGAVLVRTGRVPVRVRRRWPYYVALVLGLIPVAMFLGLLLVIVANSLPVVSDPGIAALLGTDYSSKYSAQNTHVYGLLPALWGSLLITLVAVITALPISLTLAIVAVDFPMGIIRPLVGLLSGIPPIIYAASAPFFITLLMIPKFAGNSTYSAFDPASIGADPSTWPPPGVPYSPGAIPWDISGSNNSTLLGGLLIALLLIPFVTPLFVDALRDVPRSAREASLALGANRTYTIRRAVLPRALPAMLGASMLGALKALGDTLIVAFAVGWAADQLPNPLFDVFERTSSLATQGAGLIGSFETLDASCTTTECAVGYSGALVLLLFAGVVVLGITYLQARGRQRVAA